MSVGVTTDQKKNKQEDTYVGNFDRNRFEGKGKIFNTKNELIYEGIFSEG